MPLNDAICRSAKPRDGKLTKLSDGGGLQFWVHPSGKKSWHVAYRIAVKQVTKTIGHYPGMSLRAARDAAALAKAERGAEDATKHHVSAKTFKEIKDNWSALNSREFRAAATLDKADWLLRLASPLDDKPIAEIRAPDVLALLKPLEVEGKLETARRLRSTISRVFRYAAAHGHVEADPTALLRGAIAAPKAVHRAAITDRAGLARLLQAIDAYRGRSPLVGAGLMLLALTAARPGELRMATCDEFDLAAGVWTIPAGRMKMRQPHRVPLSERAVALFKYAAAVNGQAQKAIVFPSLRPGRPLSENAFNAALRTMGFTGEEMTAHGFRASFSTLANESGLWSYDAIERALAHQDSDNVRRAYHRADYWEERKRLMDWWAGEIDAMLNSRC